MTKDRAIAILTTITILIFMSLGNVLAKRALADVKPLTMTWFTVCIGLLTMVTYTFIIRRERIPVISRQIWWYIIAIGFFNFVLNRFTSTFSLNLLPATTSTYLSNFIGFITMGMSIFILQESPTIFQVLGAVVALIGLRVFFPEIPPPSQLIGVVLIFIGITGVAYTNNIARKLAKVTNNGLSNNIVSTLAIVIGGSVTIVTGFTADVLSGPLYLGNQSSIATMVYIGVVVTGIGLTVWNKILRTLRSYEASILGASTVIWTAILAIPILGERLTGNQWAGIGLMLTGLALVQVRAGEFRRLFVPRKTEPKKIQ
jgi:drug/metabolite transporter (DMT)-like permease